MTTNVTTYPGDYQIVANGFTGKITLGGNSVLGHSTVNTINPIGEFINDLIPKTTTLYDIGADGQTWKTLWIDQITQNGIGEDYLNTIANDENVGNIYPPYPLNFKGKPYNPDDTYGGPDGEAHRKAGALYVAGGVGIEKDLNVGGFIYGRIQTATTSLSIATTATNIDYNYNLLFVAGVGTNDNGRFLQVDIEGADGGLIYNPSSGKITTDRIRVAEADEASSQNSGALQVVGGIGVGKSVYVNKDVIADRLLPKVTDQGSIGTTSTFWAKSYINQIYTKLIESTSGPLEVRPANGMTDIFGDIRVRGNNPIGTAPTVTNTLYVTVDGNDTNDGRAMDASRACRTIGGAINSPYFQPGTQILVSAGRYLEDNPLRLKPYTSVRGSDIRTTFIEPINKTQDLFHMESGCYLNYMTFLNGRSGLLEGEYETGYNRGAYATAFPPQSGDSRIDLFHSPYVQNCTNQSGPWLRDGTMFVPNQTVQVPRAIGIGSWEANTASIIVNVESGALSIGDYINPGQNNLGFFAARTLLLANKPFLQSQTVAFIDETFNSGSFDYDALSCRRDTELIIRAIATDMLYDSTSDSNFSGLQYWSQSTRTGEIPSEIAETIDAIGQLKTIAQGYISVGNQTVIGDLFDKIIDILDNGVTGISDDIDYGGLPSANPTTVSDYNALLTNRAAMQQAVIDYISFTYDSLVYDEVKCFRDVGYIIDSVAFDLLHGSNIQSIKSGVYYWGYDETSVLPTIPHNELAATTAAYNFIKGIIERIITSRPILNTYQGVQTQVLTANYGSEYEVASLKRNIDLITLIIRSGPAFAKEKTPITLIQNTSTRVLNSYNILISNIPFIVAEVEEFINATMNSFEYNRQKSYRDAGILIENIAYDMSFGGNEKSVESGLAYWNGPISVIADSLPQCLSAIDYLRDLCQLIVINEEIDVLIPPVSIPTSSQVFNYNLLGGEIAQESIEKLFNITTNIIANGPSAAPEIYNSTGPDAAFVSAEILLQANRNFIQEDVINYINYNLCDPPKALPYNQIKCARDLGVIIDSIAIDLLFPTAWSSQSTFAGLQYFTKDSFTGSINEQLGPTIDAIKYLRDLSIKVVQNITTATDALVGVERYTNGNQTTSSNYATSLEVSTIRSEFNIILSILGGKITGWTDLIVPNNGEINQLPSVQNTVNLLLSNAEYIAAEIVAYVNATNPGFIYEEETCSRDVGYIIESVAFDLLYGGNRQSIQAGLSYYDSKLSTTVIPKETTATVQAFTFLGNLVSNLVQGTYTVNLQNVVKPITDLPTGTLTDGNTLINKINIINGIITNGPSVVTEIKPVSLTKSGSIETQQAFNILKANRKFIIAETLRYLDNTFNPASFNYNQELCYRDTGLIIDAVSQDILLGGNQKSIEAGVSYWNQGYNYVSAQITTTTLAINYARDLALQIIANTPVVPQTGTVATQIINPFFQWGGEYMPQEAIQRNFGIITNIITNGKNAAPPPYAGGALFSLTGLNGSDVKIATRITSIDEIDSTTFKVGLDTFTVGFGTNSTLYFGDVYIYPLQDVQVETLSTEYTEESTTWNQRKVDPIGSMGGSLVDGNVISARSPIQSFVYDAFTQLNQGGIGVKVTNNGYAQLVSVFTIFCSIGVQCDNGGIASITNSNCNFGDISLLAKGYGTRSFSGTVYNPKYRAYPFSPDLGPESPNLDQFYPDGYWPNRGTMEVFVPDSANRPHIGQVMEVKAPEDHINEQGFPGFLNAQPSTNLLSTGTIALIGISTTDVYIGNTIYIRDQFGLQYDDNGVWYAATGTTVVDVGYNKIILNKALTSGGGEVNNPTYFTIYFCGDSYYTVQTSVTVDPNVPYVTESNILEANLNPLYQGPTVSQIEAHVHALTRLKEVVAAVISNVTVTRDGYTNLVDQVKLNLVTGGSESIPFVDLRFDYLINIVNAGSYENAITGIIPPSAITETGTIPNGAGSAITLIKENLDFLTEEIYAFVNYDSPGVIESSGYQYAKCKRDVGLILQQLMYDLETGGNYNMVYSGLSYWSRPGTYHIVELGEAVTRPDLFPDGSVVNFYQRSYISASGYLFEYVGAGINYGALPQRGVADPVQSKETVQLNSGKVFFTSTDQNGDFRIGTGLVISQATGVLSGRTFVQSLYANMTPFILAIE